MRNHAGKENYMLGQWVLRVWSHQKSWNLVMVCTWSWTVANRNLSRQARAHGPSASPQKRRPRAQHKCRHYEGHLQKSHHPQRDSYQPPKMLQPCNCQSQHHLLPHELCRANANPRLQCHLRSLRLLERTARVKMYWGLSLAKAWFDPLEKRLRSEALTDYIGLIFVSQWWIVIIIW